MAAFRRAVDLGFRYLEIDVRTSADGVLVIFHDETLDRVTNGTGKVSDHTWEQLSRVRLTTVTAANPSDEAAPVLGEPLVRFEDALQALPETHFNVDLKDSEAVKHFAEIVDRHGAHDRVLAASFNDARRHRVGRLVAKRVASSGGWVSTALMVFLGPWAVSADFRSGSRTSTALRSRFVRPGCRSCARSSWSAATGPGFRSTCGLSTTRPRCTGC